jgi:hypothetical protein
LLGAVSDLPAGSDNRALVIALGLVLGSLEARLCGVSRYVHCSLVLLGLGGQRQGWGSYVYLPANG